ncbi:hypothetical protein TFUB22_00199 [Tannerella forsythia]|nr:hypothetical protein TFUB22_00199 [Tannerella forsythia]
MVRTELQHDMLCHLRNHIFVFTVGILLAFQYFFRLPVNLTVCTYHERFFERILRLKLEVRACRRVRDAGRRSCRYTRYRRYGYGIIYLRKNSIADAQVNHTFLRYIESKRHYLTVDLDVTRYQLQVVQATRRNRLIIDDRIATVLHSFARTDFDVHVYRAVGCQSLYIDGIAVFHVDPLCRTYREMKLCATVETKVFHLERTALLLVALSAQTQ